MSATTTRARDVRFLTVEPGRISLHGVALTDAEYTMLRAIAERMKRPVEIQPISGAISSALEAFEC